MAKSAGGVAANYIAKWNGSSWAALGDGSNLNNNGVNGYVTAIGITNQIIALSTLKKSFLNRSGRPCANLSLRRGKAAVEIAVPTSSIGARCIV